MATAFYKDFVKYHVAVDCIIFGFSENELYVLLHKRPIEPAKDEWSLMGGFVRPTESVDEAASRVLTGSTGIKNVFMEQIGAYGDVMRDLGERVVSVAYYALVNMKDFDTESLQQYKTQWCKLDELPPLIFDHCQMVNDALVVIRRQAAIRPIAFNLLPEKFTLPQLQSLYETIYQTLLDKRNFRKKLISMNILKKLDEKERRTSKRGAYYYKFNKVKYDKLLKQGFYFSL